MYRHFFKRVFDILLSFLGIVILAIPMLVIAIVVKCDSKGPAIFVQDRVGKNGKVFKFYKFRSMRTDAPHDVATREIDGGKYITKVGAFLRKTSLDELPQMFCILKGDMSIIGPRPVVCTETDLIENRKNTGALSVKPGLTGLAQIRARDRLKDMSLKADVDGEYARKITFWGDLKIFFKTILIVLRGDNIEEGNGENKDDETATGEGETEVSAEVEAEIAVTENDEITTTTDEVEE